MSDTTISTWSPAEIILPSIDNDTKFAAFFVTESGSIEGLDTSFEQGDWLLYIRNKEDVGNWYKSNGGLSIFNPYTSSNQPLPGTYTKIRLDNNGNIVKADFLTEDDLPKHKHDISDIQSGFEERVQDIVGNMMSTLTNGTVSLKYDPNIKKVFADINIDDVSIKKGKFGELYLSKEFITDELPPPSQDPNGTTLPPSGDSSVVLEQVGGIFLEKGKPPLRLDVGKKTGIGNHRHLSTQIIDFDERVVSLVKNDILKSIPATAIPIDGSTIIINRDGKLSCVAMDIPKHEHVMKEISDLDPRKANEWASDQFLVGDYSIGYKDLTRCTIGYAIDILNKASGNLSEDVDSLEAFVEDFAVSKLKNASLRKNRIIKATEDGFVDSSSIEEHMKGSLEKGTPYDDNNIESVEFHAPRLDVNNLETRHITLGQKDMLDSNLPNGGDFDNGHLLENEKVSDIYASPDQIDSSVVNYLPSSSGTLINDTDMNNIISGRRDRFPVFGDNKDSDEQDICSSIIESHIYQTKSLMYDLLFDEKQKDMKSTELYESDSKLIEKEYKDINTKDIVVESDAIIGEIGDKKIKVPRSLFVTKSLILGNDNTNKTHLIPGRTLFPNSSQYKDAKTEDFTSTKDVFVEPPSKSGVLLTDNSRVDGGLYI